MEVYKDMKALPVEERQSLMAAIDVYHQNTSWREGLGLPKATTQRAPRRKVNAARREASAQEKRLYAGEFKEAKLAEYKS